MTKFPRRPRGKGYLWQRTIAMNFALSMYQWRGVWGERQTGTLQTRKGYVANLGHQEDETGFVYMRARYYEPTTGRFVSEDPARDGMNWYLYADGNPVNRVDASGKESVTSSVFLALGVLFTMLATGLYAVGTTTSFALGGIKVDRIMGCVSRIIHSTSLYSSALSVLAAWCFGMSAVGLDMSLGSQYALCILSGLSGGLLPALQLLVKGTGDMLKSVQGFAFIAVLANAVNGICQIGYIASIGVENQ